ncbi:MAG: L-ribulose-5-phosphate 4-epimerase [Calditrichaceae bacterium]
MMLQELKKKVFQANLDLVKYGLVTLTWGNVSGIDRDAGLIVIKPSGIEYDKMKIDDMVVVDLQGEVVESSRRPSSDTATHIELYKAFEKIGGITHSHSDFATSFAQACKEIPCYGTTHADHFSGTIPVTRFLSAKEAETAYELNTGKVIVETFSQMNENEIPGVLVAGHAPFTWGKDPADSVKNNLVLERVAKMALQSKIINSEVDVLPKYIRDTHYQRKHGPNAYYGQKK